MSKIPKNTAKKETSDSGLRATDEQPSGGEEQKDVHDPTPEARSPESKECQHEYVFHMNCGGFLYERCVKCNYVHITPLNDG